VFWFLYKNLVKLFQNEYYDYSALNIVISTFDSVVQYLQSILVDVTLIYLPKILIYFD